MQTFLPYKSFVKTAKCLDRQRLGKQRVECLQILRCLHNESNLGWRNHPTVKMWTGYESALTLYGISICEEWVSRGYKDTCLDKISKYRSKLKFPKWLGNNDFHSSHRAALLFKNYDWYSHFGWTEPPLINYRWPNES